jgi:hypothetical protein
MSTPYRGIPDNETWEPASAPTIASSTDASPIVITTAAAHGLTDGDAVWIIGHAANVTANGVRIARVRTPTTFALLTPSTRTNIAGAGAGAGGATGTVVPLRWSAAETVPDDAASLTTCAPINAPIEGALDRLAALAMNLVAGGEVGGVVLARTSPTNTLFTSWGSGVLTTSLWQEITDITALLPPVDVLPGDRVTIEMAFNITTSGAASDDIALGIFTSLADYGVSPVFPLAPESSARAEFTVPAAITRTAVHLIANVSQSLTYGKRLQAFLGVVSSTASVITMALSGAYTIRVSVTRKPI